MSMPLALLLAALLISSLYAAVALIAPSVAPASGPGKSSGRGAEAATVTPSADPAVSTSPSPLKSGSPSAKPSPARPSPTKDKITTWEDEVVRMTNAERSKAGCKVMLRNDARLHKAARDFSADMAARNFFSHVSPDGSTFVDREARAGYPRSQAAAENIAYGYATPAEVMKGWMNSSGHRANILNCSIRAIGVGLAYRKSTPYWTQDFGFQ